MRVIAVILCIMLTGLVQAQVYKSVGKDGSVIFSDQPTEGAEEVKVKELETVKSLETPPLPEQPKIQVQQQNIYTDLKITSPENDLAIRDNAGNLDVSVAIKPDLVSSHKLVLYLDGSKYSTGNSPGFKLENVDRGTHQLRVAVVDADGHQLIDSKSVSFHMLRFSAVKPKASPPAQKKSN